MRFPMPFPDFYAMMEPMWSAMEEFFRTPPGWSFNLPAVDIEETDDAYVVTAEVPGFDKKDIEVELHNDVLVIRGKRNTKRDAGFCAGNGRGARHSFNECCSFPAPSILTV